jgi:hypothetical protein
MIPSSASPEEIHSGDATLIALGRQFDEVTAQIDHAIDHKSDLAAGTLDQLGLIEAEILSTQAKTIDGLQVKARAACWGLLGDLDVAGQSTTNERMALSIVRDLIRLYDPQLEHPGALKRLTASLE